MDRYKLNNLINNYEKNTVEMCGFSVELKSPCVAVV